jgi:hypothetical protein
MGKGFSGRFKLFKYYSLWSGLIQFTFYLLCLMILPPKTKNIVELEISKPANKLMQGCFSFFICYLEKLSFYFTSVALFF